MTDKTSEALAEEEASVNTGSTTTEKTNKGVFGQTLLKLCNYGFRLVMLILLLLTLYVLLGRQVMPLVIDGQKGRVEQELIKVLGTELTLGELQGDWLGFSPTIIIQDLNVPIAGLVASEQVEYQQIGSLRVEFDIPASILQRQLVVAEVTLSGVSLHLQEDENGKWSAIGFSSGSGGNREPVLDFLLNTSRLELAESKITLHQLDGTVIAFNNIYAKITNFIGRHHFQSQFRFSDGGVPLQLQFELEGDPREEITGSAFLEIDKVNFAPLLAIREQRREAGIEQIGSQMHVSALETSAQLWVEFEANSILQLNGTISDLTFMGSLGESELEIDISGGSIEMALQSHDEDQWHLWLQNIQFDWHNRPWESKDFYAELDFKDDMALINIATESVDLASLTTMLGEVSLPEAGRQILDQLHPSGSLNNVHFSTDLRGNYPKGFDLTGNLDDVAVGAWDGAPSGSGVNGYLQVSLADGFVELDSTDFNLYLPRVFAQGWHYDSINSRVHWLVTDSKVTVNSSVINVQNEDIQGRVQFELNNIRNEAGFWNTDLSLLVGVQKFDASKKGDYLPTLENIESSMTWINDALLAGDVSNSGFIFRGITAGDMPSGSSTLQTFYNIENGRLQFLPEWPVLENISATVQVRNEDAEVILQNAELNQIELGASIATIRQEGDDKWLNVVSSAHTTTHSGLDFLLTTPAGDEIRDLIANWKVAGDIEADVNLDIPINNSALQSSVDITVYSRSSSLELPDFSLNIDDINGGITFSSSQGLNATDLDANMFGSPVQLNIEGYSRQLPASMLVESGTIIHSSGSVTNGELVAQKFLSEFVKDALSFSEGEINYQAQLTIFSSTNADDILSHLNINTDLQGMEFNLPEPFTKSIDESKQLTVDIDFLAESEVLTARYNNNFYTQLQFEDGVVGWGQVYFGMLNENFGIRQAHMTEPGLLISGELEYFDYDAWTEVSKVFTDDETDTVLEDKIRLIDMNIDQLMVFGLELFSINTQVNHSESAWMVYLENEVLQGVIAVPDDVDSPYEIHFDYIHIPDLDDENTVESSLAEIEGEAETVDMFAEIDPNFLPAMNFSAKDFSIGDLKLGQWSFFARENSRGLSISDFKVEMENARITDLNAENGAELEWLYSEGVHTTRFIGMLTAGDLSTVLPDWGFSANVETESALFLGNIEWQGSPAAFALKTATGEIDVDIQNGRFVDISTGGSRLLGVLNFDSIVRRLKLDFSDLYKSGLAFDEISGELLLTDGIIQTRDRFLIDGPSSVINVDGELNLVDETVNADLLVSIPIGQNAAVVAGLVGAWPVAVGAFIASKIFRDQFAGLTAVRYRLEGPWSGLETGFESADDSEIEAE